MAVLPLDPLIRGVFGTSDAAYNITRYMLEASYPFDPVLVRILRDKYKNKLVARGKDYAQVKMIVDEAYARYTNKAAAPVPERPINDLIRQVFGDTSTAQNVTQYMQAAGMPFDLSFVQLLKSKFYDKLMSDGRNYDKAVLILDTAFARWKTTEAGAAVEQAQAQITAAKQAEAGARPGQIFMAAQQATQGAGPSFTPGGPSVNPAIAAPGASAYIMSDQWESDLIEGLNMKPSHMAFLKWFTARYPQYARAWGVQASAATRGLGAVYDQDGNELGDIWSETRDKILGKVSAAADKAGAIIKDISAKVAPADLVKAAAEAKLIKTNIERAERGLPPINAVDVGGFGDLKMLGGALLFMIAYGVFVKK